MRAGKNRGRERILKNREERQKKNLPKKKKPPVGRRHNLKWRGEHAKGHGKKRRRQVAPFLGLGVGRLTRSWGTLFKKRSPW